MQKPLFILFGSEGCHLCELALDMCKHIVAQEQLNIVDIVDDEQLVEKYGVHIPVLKRTKDNNELYWPFSQEDIIEFYQYGIN